MPEKFETRALTEIGEVIYSIRWGLIPMYVLLWVAIIAYNVHFIEEIIHFLFHWEPGHWFPTFKRNDSTSYLLWILALIDVTMIGNLVVMTTVGGYSTFVKEYQMNNLEGRPRWMNGLDSMTLKIKMGVSLIAVSAIHLLKTFMMDSENVDWDKVWMQVVIHMVFIATTVAFSVTALLSDKHHSTHPKPHPDQ